MENSILTSTKKMLGLAEDYAAFDLDIIICINSAFSILHQLGVGPDDGFAIEDSGSEWTDFIDEGPQLNLARTYVFLKARAVFDPPATSFAIDAMNKQIVEHEWRLNINREKEITDLAS